MKNENCQKKKKRYLHISILLVNVLNKHLSFSLKILFQNEGSSVW